MSKTKPRRNAAKWLHLHHSRKGMDITDRTGGPGFDEAQGHVLSLGDVPLESEEIVDALAHGAGHDGYACGERQAERGKEGLPRAAFEISQRHAERGPDQMGEADPLEKGWLVLGG